MFERASEDEEGFSSGLIKGTRTAARSAARSRNCGIHGPEAALVWAAELFWAAISFLGWTVTCVMLCEASRLADGDGTEAVSRRLVSAFGFVKGKARDLI